MAKPVEAGQSYRDYFNSRERAERYEQIQYRSGSYGTLLWELEKRSLMKIVGQLRACHERLDYLDFATGTGRLLGFMEDKVDSATGGGCARSDAGAGATQGAVCGTGLR